MYDAERRRKLFPALAEGRLFLNHAGISPMTGPAVQALRRHAVESSNGDPKVWPAWWQAVADVRGKIADLIGATPQEIAFVGNTTQGIAAVANGLGFDPGDRVLGFEDDYPANVYPWRRLEAQGVEHELLPVRPNGYPRLNRLEKVVDDDVRVVTVSSVSFATGARAPLQRIGEIAHAHDAFLVVDGIQSLGALRMDVRELGIDFLACGGHKWLMAPQGIGFLYVRSELLHQLEVTMPGADSMDPAQPYRDYHGHFRAGAARLEGGTLPVDNVLALGACLDLLLEAGPAKVEKQVMANTDTLCQGLAERGYDVVSPRGEREGSGIVAARHPEREPAEVVRHLADRGVVAVEREGMLRLAPHYYHTTDDMKRVVDALPD